MDERILLEIYGPESGGKTTLALHIVAEAQKKNGIAAYIDAEHALDMTYAKKIGVNYFPPIDMIDDVSENDVQLDYLLIPDEILSFFSGTSIFTK